MKTPAEVSEIIIGKMVDRLNAGFTPSHELWQKVIQEELEYWQKEILASKPAKKKKR